MAVLNSLLRGQLKGRIGNNWFAHARDAKGRPVTRTGTINTTPNNPRSASQQQRRAKFANAVKFYQRAQHNFFKFAFEDKKKNESDYNAFMRHNIDNSLILDKSLVQNSNFPALGNQWQLSQGNLTNWLLTDNESGWVSESYFQVAMVGGTIGELSQDVINRYKMPVGTIITVVFVGTQLTIDNINNDTPSLMQPIWNIFQMIVDPYDNTSIDNMPHTSNLMYNEIAEGGTDTTFTFLQAYPTLWGGVVISRKKNGGLYCTTSYLMPNANAANLIEYYQELERVTAATESWEKSDETILQGSVAGATSRVTTVNGEAKPLDLGTVNANGTINLTILGKKMDETKKSDFDITNGTITGIGVLTKVDGVYLGLKYGAKNGPGQLTCENEIIAKWSVVNGDSVSNGTSDSSSSTSGGVNENHNSRDTDKSSQDANA